MPKNDNISKPEDPLLEDFQIANLSEVPEAIQRLRMNTRKLMDQMGLLRLENSRAFEVAREYVNGIELESSRLEDALDGEVAGLLEGILASNRRHPEKPDHLLRLFKFVRSLRKRIQDKEWETFLGIWCALYELDTPAYLDRDGLLDCSLMAASRQAGRDHIILIEQCAKIAEDVQKEAEQHPSEECCCHHACETIAAKIRSLK